MNRRGFFRMLGVAPLGIPATALAVSQEDAAPPSPHGVYPAWGHLSLSSHPEAGGHAVDMTSGKDGMLWIRPRGTKTWRKVTTE